MNNLPDPSADPVKSSSRRASRSPLSQRLVEWGMAVCLVGIVLALVIPPAIRSQEPHRRSDCKMHLKQIGLALHHYHEKYHGLPPAYTVDANGNRLHSWRTLILPFLQQQALYDKIDLTRPWDDPVNAEARQTVIPEYSCPSDTKNPTHTSYVAFVGERFALHPTRSRSFRDVTDGLSNTMFAMEIPRENSWNWMQPRDADESLFLNVSPESRINHTGGFHGLLGDGSVRFISANFEASNRLDLVMINDGHVLCCAFDADDIQASPNSPSHSHE